MLQRTGEVKNLTQCFCEEYVTETNILRPQLCPVSLSLGMPPQEKQ